MRQYHFLLLTLLACCLAGCAADDGTERPDNLVASDKMANILTEVHLAEAEVGRFNLRATDSSRLVFNRLQERILKRYEVDTATYRKSYNYYSSHPDQFEKIYKTVTQKLDQLSKPSSGSPGSGSAPTGPSSRAGFTLSRSLSTS